MNLLQNIEISTINSDSLEINKQVALFEKFIEFNINLGIKYKDFSSFSIHNLEFNNKNKITFRFKHLKLL